jgi:branched-subunit amino acid transport protein
MTTWVVLGLCGAACYLLRIVPVEVLGRIEAPGWLDRVAMLMAPVALTAVAVAAVAGAASSGLTASLPRAAALIVAAVVAHRTRSTAATVATGMLTLWLTSAVLAS